ncbi:MAG: hypothetical protein ACYC9O_06960 [Candidatus Latescibacterota bacterium]
MKNHIVEMKRKYVEALGHTALQYLESGMELLHRHFRSESSSGQAAFGNLATALELMLKCTIAEKNIGAVFRDMPPEARALLSAPDRIPDFFRWRGIPINLGSDAYRTLDLEGCIACYYVFFPHMKQPLLPYHEFIAARRDAAFHAVLSPLEPYELERAGYGVLQTVQSLERDAAFSHFAYTVSEADNAFLDRFAAKRAERLSLALEQAKHALNEPASKRTPETAGWNAYTAFCPVCRTEASLHGYTELSIGRDEEGLAPTLDFFAVSFSCPRCGLTLYDFDELKFAGMATLYDRSGELDAWFAEHGSFPEWEME